MSSEEAWTGRGAPMLTYAEVATATAVSKATVGRMVRSGRLKSVRFGPRSVRVPAEALKAFLMQGGTRDDRTDDA